jgi:hypothetical protein
MYLALRQPWAHRDGSPAPVVVAVAPGDAGVDARPAKKKHRPRGGGTTAADPAGATPGDDGPEDTEPAPLTEADRRLEWRGDEVALPPRTISMEGGAEARSLDDGEIQTTVNGQAGGVRDCLVAEATGTDLKATITIKLVVDDKGRVGKSRVQAPHYLFEHGLLGCAQRNLAKLRFPATGAATLVTVPFTLG